MHKLSIPISPATPPKRRKWSLFKSAAILIVGMSLAPLVVECTNLCYSQWSQVMGKNVNAHTPIIDTVQDSIESSHRSAWGSLAAWFQRVPWSPSVVLPVGTIIMLVAMAMLKK